MILSHYEITFLTFHSVKITACENITSIQWIKPNLVENVIMVIMFFHKALIKQFTYLEPM